MKKNESKSHLRPGNRVSYFTYEDLDVIPKVLEQSKTFIDTDYIFKLNVLQNKIESNLPPLMIMSEQLPIYDLHLVHLWSLVCAGFLSVQIYIYLVC